MFRYLLLFVLFSTSAMAQFVSPEARNMARQSVMMKNPEPELLPAPVLLDDDIKIVMVINGEMISKKDLNDRIRAFSFNLNIPINAETKDMMIARVKQATIDEKLKIVEAEREKINISDKEIDEAVENLAEGNGKTLAEFKQEFRNAGVDFDVFRTQIKSDLAWIRLVRQKSMGQIEASRKEVERFISDIETNINSEKVRISEIVIPKDSAGNISTLVYNLRNDPRFPLFAMQFSKSPSSAKGGDLGWINKNMLMPKIRVAVQNMEEKEISDPIEIGEDYHIIRLEKIYDPKEDKAKVPSFNEAKRTIEGNRIEEFASNYLNKIRQKAIIEIKE